MICAGGGGIPTDVRRRRHQLHGVEAVIDKDLALSAARRADSAPDLLVIATDVDGVYLDWGSPQQRRVVAAHPQVLTGPAGPGFAAGSMGPKVEAACRFAEKSGGTAVIGSLSDIEEIVAGRAGTRISTDVDGLSTT